MKLVGALAACVASSACADLLSLDELEPPPPCTEVGHDEDGDGVDDGCDACPFDTNNARDADDDGIASACDPDDAVPHDQVLFASFASATGFQVFGGGFVADAYRAIGPGANALLWPMDTTDVSVIAGVRVSALHAPTEYKEVGVVFDARPPTTTNNQIAGSYCVLGRNPIGRDYLEVYARDRALGADEAIHSSTPLYSLEALDHRISASFSRTSTPQVACNFESTVGITAIAADRDEAPPVGGLGLFVQNADVDIKYLFVTRRR